MNQPVAVVLGGINGAGKTTAARSLLTEQLKIPTFVNADNIAVGLSAFSPESVGIAAGRIMLERLNELKNERASLAFESTLSGKSYVSFLQELHGIGYFIKVFYFWLPSI